MSLSNYSRIFCSVFFLFLVFVTPHPAHALSDQIYKDLATFSQIMEIIDKQYVTEVDGHKMIVGAIEGMLSTLDPHSVYLPQETYKDFKSDTRGRFGGVGIEVTLKDGLLTIVSPIEGTPGFEAGLKSGDRILGIDGKSTKNMNLGDAVHLMRGPIGSTITLMIWPAGRTRAHKVVLKRELIKVSSVKTEDLGNGVGYFRITMFQEGTAKLLKEALDGFQSKSGALKGIVLDLRDNPGGLLSEAVLMADLFVDKGVIVSTRGRKKESEVHRASTPSPYEKIPMTVLINEGTASASEIVAGALQDHHRAKLVGTKSYGKGSVQTVVNMDDGAALKFTIAHYYTPSNRMIDGKGIDPDVLVDRVAFKKKTEPEAIHKKKDEAEEKARAEKRSQKRKEFAEFQKSKAVEMLK